MDDWKPKPNFALDFQHLELDPEQGYVLSRIDGSTTFRELVLLTGMTREAVRAVLLLLVRADAVLAENLPDELVTQTDADDLLNTLDEQFPVDDLSGENTALDGPVIQTGSHNAGSADGAAGIQDRAALEDLRSGEKAAPSIASANAESASWSGVYRERWKDAPVAERIDAARRASSDELHAFCFDQNARVLRAVLENSQVGLSHARLLAAHHVNGAGLDALAKKNQFLRDGQVQRAIMRNAQLSEALLGRILQPKPLADVHRIALSRDVTERVRQQARKAFRSKFTRASAEEKVNLIVRSEGRCLTGLVGVALDGKSAALLSQRPIQSTLLVQNLVRWPSTPPPVLVHLSKQPVVLRSPPLKNLVLRHPNASAQLKRQLR